MFHKLVTLGSCWRTKFWARTKPDGPHLIQTNLFLVSLDDSLKNEQPIFIRLISLLFDTVESFLWGMVFFRLLSLTSFNVLHTIWPVTETPGFHRCMCWVRSAYPSVSQCKVVYIWKCAWCHISRTFYYL